MKNIIIFSMFFLLGGCAAGINHNVVMFDDKPYLVQTKNYAFFIPQWSSPSKITPLTKPSQFEETKVPNRQLPGQLTSSEQLNEIIKKCRIKDGLSSRKVNYRLLYKCVVEELAKLEQ